VIGAYLLSDRELDSSTVLHGYCARAVGATTSRFDGASEEMLDRYNWYFRNSKERAWPVGRLKRSHFGLFAVYCNVIMVARHVGLYVARTLR